MRPAFEEAVYFRGFETEGYSSTVNSAALFIASHRIQSEINRHFLKPELIIETFRETSEEIHFVQDIFLTNWTTNGSSLVVLIMSGVRSLAFMENVFVFGNMDDENSQLLKESIVPITQAYQTRRTYVRIFQHVYFQRCSGAYGLAGIFSPNESHSFSVLLHLVYSAWLETITFKKLQVASFR